MARWRLRNAHYLNVPGTEWEYTETNRETGKRGRKVFAVPLMLDTNNQADYNYPDEIIVCHEGKGERKDIVFVGDPTPDMEPLDAEAEAISKSFESRWVHPIDTLPANGDYSQSLVKAFEKQISELTKIVVPNTAIPGIDAAAFKEMQEQIAALMAQNAELKQAAGKRV